LHCIKNGLTAGCIAIDKEAMKIVMENIDKQTKIKI
jgi:L,D-peptidoglycan transpeptidase YkuD (ErfK/YbiS/YcfS/YnhG family)